MGNIPKGTPSQNGTSEDQAKAQAFADLLSVATSRSGKSDIADRTITLNPDYASGYAASVRAGKASALPPQLASIVRYIVAHGGTMRVMDLGAVKGEFADGSDFLTRSGTRAVQSPIEVLDHYRGNATWSEVVCALTGLPKPVRRKN